MGGNHERSKIQKEHGFFEIPAIWPNVRTILESGLEQLLSGLHLGAIFVILCHGSQVSTEGKSLPKPSINFQKSPATDYEMEPQTWQLLLFARIEHVKYRLGFVNTAPNEDKIGIKQFISGIRVEI